MNIQDVVEQAWANRDHLENSDVVKKIDEVIERLDKGELRVSISGDGKWTHIGWVRKAIELFVSYRPMEEIKYGVVEFHDNLAIKRNYASTGVRVVPNAVAKYGACIRKGVVLMPSSVEIGAYIDEGTTVDTWASVGACAQVGKDVHLSGGVSLAGVLGSLDRSPVIVEDNVFIGSRCVIGPGTHICKEAVIGANVILAENSRIIDVSGPEPLEYHNYIPERSVVIPGYYPMEAPSGKFSLPCALIIGKRKESTEKKTTLNDALHAHNVSV